MEEAVEKKAKLYREHIRNLAKDESPYQVLHDFVNVNFHQCQESAKITVLTITEANRDKGQVTTTHLNTPIQLARFLGNSFVPEGTCRLFIIENICPETIAIIGSQFDINPQFFAAHVNNAPWYRSERGIDHTSILPSTLKAVDFLQVQYIVPIVVLAMEGYDARTTARRYRRPSLLEADLDVNDPLAQQPDQMSTRIPRKAGVVMHKPLAGLNHMHVLFTRQVASVWIQRLKIETSQGGWTGVLLVDPVFQLPPNAPFSKKKSESRAFSLFPRSTSPAPRHLSPESPSRDLFAHYIQEMLHNNPSLLRLILLEPYYVLKPIYALVSHNWLAVNEHFDRELGAMEYLLEYKEFGFHGLEAHLKDLYICRRRCTKYHDLITQTRIQSQRHGQCSWRSRKGERLQHEQNFENGNMRDQEEDFMFLEKRFEDTAARIEKSLRLITALVAIGEARQGLRENQGVARLTLLATVFLPFSTVATILSIQGDYGPGERRFWVFWGVAIPLTLFVVGLQLFRFQSKARDLLRWVGENFVRSLKRASQGSSEKVEDV